MTIAAAQEPPAPPPDFPKLARTFVIELATGQFDKAAAQFDATMFQALPESKLAEVWSGLLAQFGALKGITGVRMETAQKLRIALVTCQFEKAALEAKISFTADAKIAGLFFVPAAAGGSAPPSGWNAPPYVNSSAFHEEAITVSDGHWELPGTVTTPAGDGPFPAVVMLQGSGPHDADETIGPNKPFKDIAWGLASRGIAALRYTKRTAKYGMQSSDDVNSLTVRDETMDDARAAVALAARQPHVDPKRVYLLGHSLGAFLAPRIANGDPQIAGLILLAGNTRPTEQLIVEQVRYLTGRNGPVTPEGQKQIDAAEQIAREVESPDLKPGATINIFGGQTPSSYWLDLRSYHPAEVAAGLKLPILVLQGDKDYQVRIADFDGWKKALAGHANATFKLYPSLNHLFMISAATSDGLSSPSEYSKPGHVSPEVVQDIAAWISAQGNRAK